MVDRRIRNARARRPQLNREALGSPNGESPVTLGAVLKVGTVPQRLLLAALVGGGIGCHRAAAVPTCELGAAPGLYGHTDNTLVFELPEAGGYLANGVPLTAAQLEPQLRAVFAQRPESTRVVFGRPTPSVRCADLRALAAAARAAGGYAFDAQASGWPQCKP